MVSTILICGCSVVWYHLSLPSLKLGFKSRRPHLPAILPVEPSIRAIYSRSLISRNELILISRSFTFLSKSLSIARVNFRFGIRIEYVLNLLCFSKTKELAGIYTHIYNFIINILFQNISLETLFCANHHILILFHNIHSDNI